MATSSIHGTIESARRLQQIAEQAGHAELARTIGAEVIDYLGKAEVTVAVIGEFASGKSSLLNRLLDTDILPVKPDPTTAKITEIRPGARAQGFRFDDGRELPLDEQAFRSIAAGNRLPPGAGVTWLRLPHSLLGERLCLVDTPGVESLSTDHDDITFGYLPRVDAAIVAIDGEKGALSESVLRFLKDRVLRTDLEKLVFALNKMDLKAPAERTQIAEGIRRTLVEVGVRDPRVLSVSAHRDDPGPGALRDYLVDDITPAASAIVESRGRQRLDRHAGLLLSALEAQREALGTGSDAAVEARMAELREARARIDADLKRLEAEVRRRIGDLRARVPRLVDALLASVRSESDRYLEACVRNKQRPDELSQKLSGWVARGLEHLSTTEVEPVLRDVTDRVQTGARALQTKVPELAIAIPEGGTNPIVDIAVEVLLVAAINFVVPGGWIEAVVGRILGKSLLAGLKRSIADAISGVIERFFQGGVAKALSATVGTQIDGMRATLVDQIERQLQENESATVQAVRAHFDALLGTQDKALADARDELRRGEAQARAKADQVRAMSDEVRRVMGR